MEHSALHALLLTGLVVALGGPIAVLWLILPAGRVVGLEFSSDRPSVAMIHGVNRLVACGALVAMGATFVDFFVQVAEFQGQTVFGGADFSVVTRFATETIVGKLCLARAGLLFLTFCATRIPLRTNWWLVAIPAWGAVIVTSLVSHAAAQPDHRLLAIAGQIAHITAVALWMGVLLNLFVVRKHWLHDGCRIDFVAEVVRRFSPLALTMTSLLALTGVTAAYRYLTSMEALFTSPYGLTLLVKLVLLAPAIYAGYVNFRFIGPWLLTMAGEKSTVSSVTNDVIPWFSRMLELEITAGILVITVAGVLGSVSPPGEDGAQRLTVSQTHAVLSPHRPNTDISGWDQPEDPRGPTVGDLRYSEFTHNWSGIAVCLLGLSWLAQGVKGRTGYFGARLSALVLIPFGCFIAIAANPELWILRRVKASEALTNPILLEHQLGAVMVFILAWLTWRDRKNPENMRPLGYPLPVIMILGSLLLLGHAHSATSIPDDLTNLINVQHAVFGAFGLFAGATRLLILRGLLRTPAARFVWPSFVVGLGLFMAFIYREVV